MTPAFTFPDTLTIYIYSKDLFVVLLNRFGSLHGPIDYGMIVKVRNEEYQFWWLNVRNGLYRKDIEHDLDSLGMYLRNTQQSNLIFILQEYSEENHYVAHLYT